MFYNRRVLIHQLQFWFVQFPLLRVLLVCILFHLFCHRNALLLYIIKLSTQIIQFHFKTTFATLLFKLSIVADLRLGTFNKSLASSHWYRLSWYWLLDSLCWTFELVIKNTKFDSVSGTGSYCNDLQTFKERKKTM